MNYIIGFLVVFAFFNLLFLAALAKKDNSIVDIGWGLSFIIGAVTALWLGSPTVAGILATTLVVVWGLRLSIRIYQRNQGKGEDPRYKKWRREWKYFKLRSYFQIFTLQAILAFIILTPVLALNLNATNFHYLAGILGLLVWAVGFYFEVVGDYQLDQFLKQKTEDSAVMNRGLWHYTRHPNYFGEATMWWGLWIIALSNPQNWWTVIGPLAITFLLLKISGIPILEKKMMKNPKYQKYAERTNKFIPGRPK